MRFLHTRTGRFCWVDDPKETPFAILSHVWIKNPPPPGEVPEQSYEEVLRIAQITLPDKDSSILPMLHRKIQKFCEVALKDGFDLCWLRSSFTLCIPHRHTGLEVALQRDENIHKSLKEVSQFFEVRLSKWSRQALERAGYRIVLPRRGEDPDITPSSRNRAISGVEKTEDGLPSQVHLRSGKVTRSSSAWGVAAARTDVRQGCLSWEWR
ncbi:hypothetical protein BD309DRAFT_370262 [Dichomitus squalens]|uniref:Uncharacterized protein n=1 Tax=Dichomitus squalens TaxID=114155 RepID=A0A4Q9P5S3_9APHY|nr:hypothetical protein BD309DRAFT_370262 [Dichomitus squalens]TBU59406.1 hypothetical protein BD310DRAFT_414149 [Dichomitus squalens]